MKKQLTDLNNKIAIKLTYIFGTMGMFWMTFVWAILPLIPSLSSYKDMILYVSAGIVQLVALPLLMVGNKLLSESSEIRAQQDHETIMKEFNEIKKIHNDLHVLLMLVRSEVRDNMIKNQNLENNH